MSDAKLEAKLAKYRAAGPPDDLRDRVVSIPARDTRVGWMSIAALLFVIVLLQVLAAGERASVLRTVDPPDLSRDAVVRDLVRGLGGDERARRVIEALARRDELAKRGAIPRWSGIAREVHP